MDLEQRIEELERRVAALEAKKSPSKSSRIKPCAVDDELAVAMQRCQSDGDFVPQTRTKEIDAPATLGGLPHGNAELSSDTAND
jgi:hypothetical protein